MFPLPSSEEVVNEIAPEPALKNQTLEVSVEKSYVICPDEDCNEWIVINSDDEIIDCENCGTMSNIKILKKFPLLNAEEMNRQSVMKELKRQQDKIDRAEKSKESIAASPVRGKKGSSLKKTPIKRKKTFSDRSSTQRVQSHRSKLDNDTKAKIQADNTKKHKIRRAELDIDAKVEIQNKNTKYQRSKRSNLDDNVKAEIQADNTRKHKTR